MKKTPIALAAGILLVAGSASANEDNFKKVDTDGNGSLSMTEIVTAHPEVDAKVFKSIDTDGNGELSPQEYQMATNSTDKGKTSTQ